MADLESEILGFSPAFYLPGRVFSGVLTDRSGNNRNATIAGDASAAGAAMFSGSNSPSDSVGTSGTFDIAQPTSGLVMAAADNWTIGCAFFGTPSGTVTLLSNQTCTHLVYSVDLVSGVLDIRIGSFVINPPEHHVDPSGTNYADGVPHIVILTRHAATGEIFVWTDGVQRYSFVPGYVGDLSEGGSNHWLGTYELCGRAQPFLGGFLGHWFGINHELFGLDIGAIQTSAGTAFTGAALQPPSIQSTQAIVTASQATLDQILAAVQKTFPRT